ncbi:hypothetical protein BS333_21265 (plasmid) [Vibrio azureus]|uniref:DUF2857 domain-containing protein n=1 Tax=Vibrio azureus NBRC 104587 TaxID=1219077 RepID=U3C415_9VIBR|nr:STY4526/YPO1902 family pathogenicity island replication protein [Vibrio azureus]AUI88912.1 hypothetical protein BS333_21265 [Vibrio azureus]GAD76179.1 hypothetical protein VAZ01S_039_00040 [Vibrio azureus NBRC 104587]
MIQSRDVLASELCHVVVAKLAYLAGTGQGEMLKTVGVSDKQIIQLNKLSLNEINQLVAKNQIDVRGFVNSVLDELNDDVPEQYKTYLEYGANNKMMFRYFNVQAAQCSSWRSSLTIEPPFRARSIAHKKHSAVCKALQAEGPYQQISAEALLKIAKTYQVSLCALWKELEEWNKYDQ